MLNAFHRVSRTFDASALNHVANHPNVRPWLTQEGDVDWTPLVEDSNNVCLMAEGGGWLFHNLGEGRYEAHSQFLPDARGAGVFAAAREALRFMFTATDCLEIVSKVPLCNAGAIGLSRWNGFQEVFRRDRAWVSPSGEVSAMSYVSLPIERWTMRDPDCLAAGRWFHEGLEAAKTAAGSSLPIHPEDEAHDRYVGASVLMVAASNPRKGVATYNRWAGFVGYAPVALLSEDPVTIDVRDAIVGLRDEKLEVFECRGARSQQVSAP